METTEISLTRGQVTIIDAVDLPLLQGFNWHAQRARNATWYAKRTVLLDGVNRAILMHRVILQAPLKIFVDHRNGNGLDNRRENLRLASVMQNGQNRRLNSNRRFKGVWRKPGRDRWAAQIRVNLKLIHLGTFSDEVAAARAYDEAAHHYFGEFARTNFGVQK